MKILITGATGLVGMHLVKHFIAIGYEVNFLTTQQSKLNNYPNCKGFLWNIKNKEIDLNCLDGVSIIIHLAGANIGKRWTRSYKEEIITSRISGANLIYETLKSTENQISHYISASAIGIYQHSFTEVHTEESNKFGTNFLAEVVSKWEQSANIFSTLNIKVTKVRTGIVLDKNLGALPKMVNPIKIGFGASLASGKQKMSWIHVSDLVRIYEFVIKQELIDTVNAVAPEVVTNTYFTENIATLINKRIWLPNVPKFMLSFLLGEMHLLLTESQHVSPEKIIKNGFIFEYPILKTTLKSIL